MQGKSSGEYEYGKCKKKAKLKRCNWGGEHSSAGCEVSKRVSEILRVKGILGISYAEATRKVPETLSVPGQNENIADESINIKYININESVLDVIR